MDALNSLLTKQINAVLTNRQPVANHEWTIKFKTDSEIITPLAVEEVYITRHYTKAIGDSISIRVTIGAGDYTYGIYPNRTKLKACLIKQTLYATVNYSPNPHLPIDTLWFDAHLFETSSPAVEQNTRKLENREKANINSILTIEFMLIDPAIDVLRKSTTGGTVHQANGAEAIRAIITNSFSSIKDLTGRQLQGVDLAPGYQTSKLDNMLIPSHTPLVEVFRVINTEVGGIYGAGCWAYLQGDHYYVYPPYDSSRYLKSPRRLSCINVSGQQLQHSEHTWMYVDGELTYLSTGQTIHEDPSEIKQLNDGNAVRFMDPNRLLNDYVQVDNNRAIADQSKAANEFTNVQRPDGLNITKLAEKPITSKVNIEAGKLAMRAGYFVQTRWDNADPDLIYPGMPARYQYLSTDKEVITLHGTVVGVQARDTPHQAMIKDRKFTTQAAVTLFLNRTPADTVST